jgi:hypothetical protein
MKLNIIMILVLLASEAMWAKTDVEEICSKTGLPIVDLNYRDREGNIVKIRNSKLGTSHWGKFLQNYYAQKLISKDESLQVQLTNSKNEAFIKDSELKKIALTWAGREQRTKDRLGYIKNIFRFIELSIPSLDKELKIFMNYKNNDLIASYVTSEVKNDSDFHGARGGAFLDEGTGKYVREITISNNPSETFPYLAPLIGHELVHAVDFFNHRKILRQTTKLQNIKFALLNEAKAYDAQIAYYLEGARKNPDLFCNWLTPSWSYGEMIVPLSWTMNAMEKEARAGQTVLKQFKLPLYESYAIFFKMKNEEKLSDELQKEVDKLNLRYVK